MASFDSLAQKKSSLLPYPGFSNLLDVLTKETWGQRAIVKDNLYELVYGLLVIAPPPFKYMEEDEDHHHVSLFDDHPVGNGVTYKISPSTLRMRVEREELPWAEARFESKTWSNLAFEARLQKTQWVSGVSQRFNYTCFKMPIIYARICPLSRQFLDLEVLLSQLSMKTHTFVIASGLTLEDDLYLTHLPLFNEANPMEIVLDGDNQLKLKYLLATITALRSSEKSTYATWLRFFHERDASISDFMVEAFLVVLVYTVDRAGGWTQLECFPLAIQVAKGVKFALALCSWGLYT